MSTPDHFLQDPHRYRIVDTTGNIRVIRSTSENDAIAKYNKMYKLDVVEIRYLNKGE